MAEANASPECIGLIGWMHTFSPARMWIAGLDLARKPLLHLRTQYNREIPWAEIDKDFMNHNQAAHGDRVFGSIAAIEFLAIDESTELESFRDRLRWNDL